MIRASFCTSDCFVPQSLEYKVNKILRKFDLIFVQPIVMLCIVPVDPKDIPEKKGQKFCLGKYLRKSFAGKSFGGWEKWKE